MKKFLFSCILISLMSLTSAYAQMSAKKLGMMDTILLKDGRSINGVIVRNTYKEIVIQEPYRETTYSKSEVVRIFDKPDLHKSMTVVLKCGELPAWRTIANDLRTIDSVTSVLQMPSVIQEEGVFRNMPYMAFLVDKVMEIDIYGDPDHPAGVEMGIYGWWFGVDKAYKTIRAYLAGYLTTNEEIAALYDICMKKGGKRTVGSITIEIEPCNSPNSYNAWWISIYNEKKLNALRVSDTQYHKLALPVQDVQTRSGRIFNLGWKPAEVKMSDGKNITTEKMQEYMGFYRDARGHFKPLTSQGD